MVTRTAARGRTRTQRTSERGGNQAVTRLLTVLSVFADGQPSHGVTELSRRLGMTKSMVFRALATLLDHGFLIRDESGSQYQLGFRVLEFGQESLNAPDLQTLSAPYMRRMHEMTGETVTLAVPAGHVSVIVDGIEGRGPIARRVPLGRLTPLHASTASRTLLAFMDDEEIGAYLRRPLERYNEQTLTTAEELWADVRQTRAQGYTLGRGDHMTNLEGVGFPVLDRNGRPVGAVTVAGPSERFTPERIAELLPELQVIAAEMNHRSRLYLRAAEARLDEAAS